MEEITHLKSYKDFLPLFNKEITFDDLRSISMPSYNIKGLIVGIRLDSVEIRVNNVMTQWYPINHLKIKYHI